MKSKVRPIPKGRAVDPKAREEVRALLGDAPRNRDLLIEHLHRINDRYGHLPARHLAALAQEMRLALTEVYEVATFYHHFEVVKETESPPRPRRIWLIQPAARRCALYPRRASAAARSRRAWWWARTRSVMRRSTR
jgi:hypothetical protein